MLLRPFLPGLAVVLGSLLFATDAYFRERALLALDPAAVGFLEHGIAFFSLLPWVFARRREEVRRPLVERVSRRDILLFIAIGLGGSALGSTLFTVSVEKIGGTGATLFTMLQPIFVLGFARLLLREKFSSFFVPCAFWVVANMILLAFAQAPQDAFAGFEENPGIGTGIFCGLAAALVWGGSTVAGKALLARYPNSVVLIWRWAIAFVALGLVVAVRGVAIPWERLADRDVLGPLLYLGVVAQTTAYWIYYVGLRKLPASLATFIELLYPLVGMFVPVFASGRPASPLQGFAALTLFIAIGLLLGSEYPRAVGMRRHPRSSA